MKKPATNHPAVRRPPAPASKLDARMAHQQRGSEQPMGGRGGYDVDDEVFFSGKSGPMSGRVICLGQHGCTVCDSTGERHQVLWESMLGLKGRKTFPARVVDRGSSGSIMEREDGSRFYVSGDIPVAEDPDDLEFDEVMHKADTVARLGERIALLGAPSLRADVLGGMPLLWGADVP